MHVTIELLRTHEITQTNFQVAKTAQNNIFNMLILNKLPRNKNTNRINVTKSSSEVC